MMEVKAQFKNTGISARKVRVIMDMVRGKSVKEALVMLKYSTSPSAQVVAKAVKSAAANAENNYSMDYDNLKIVKIFADDAPMLKRYQPRARGSADQILKRSSHITVVVEEQEA